MIEPDDRDPSPEQPRDEPFTPLTPPGQPPYGSPPPPPPGPPYGGPPPGPPHGGAPPYGGPPPPYGPGPYPPPYGQQEGITSADDPTWALAAYVGQLIISIIAPLIVFFVRKDQSPFVRFHGAQALNLALSYIAVMIASFALIFISAAAKTPIGLIVGVLVMIIFAIVHFVYLVIGGVKAGRREMYRLPAWICWPMVK